MASTLLNFRCCKNELVLFSVTEQPELTLGAHVWDCALPLAYHLQKSFTTFPPTAASTSSRLRIIELGAGCGIVGLVAAEAARAAGLKAFTYLTDIDQVVSAATTPVLEKQAKALRKSVHAAVLDWELPDASLVDHDDPLLILATDVLYNVESHEPFLKCLLALLGEGHDRVAWIAYKPRSADDDGFFAQAKSSGLAVHRAEDLEDLVQNVQLYRLSAH